MKEELSKLNATCHVTADDDNLYIIMEATKPPCRKPVSYFHARF